MLLLAKHFLGLVRENEEIDRWIDIGALMFIKIKLDHQDW